MLPAPARAADRVVRGRAVDLDAVAVAQGIGAGLVGADQLPCTAVPVVPARARCPRRVARDDVRVAGCQPADHDPGRAARPCTPNVPLPRAIVPDLSVPIRLPRTTPASRAPLDRYARHLFAEITLPAPCAVPPIVVPGAASTSTPLPRSPAVRLRSGRPRRNCPGSACWSRRSRTRCRRRFPEITLRASDVVPPMVVPVPPASWMPAKIAHGSGPLDVGADQVSGHQRAGRGRRR